MAGLTIRTGGLSAGAGFGGWSSAFKATESLMVLMIRLSGYLSQKKIRLNRSHSTEKYDQQADKRYVRSSMVFNSPRLQRISTWLWLWSKSPVLVGLT